MSEIKELFKELNLLDDCGKWKLLINRKPQDITVVLDNDSTVIYSDCNEYRSAFDSYVGSRCGALFDAIGIKSEQA